VFFFHLQVTPIIPEKAISAIKREGHRQLVGQLLSVNPEKRPEMASVLDDPVFALGVRTLLSEVANGFDYSKCISFMICLSFTSLCTFFSDSFKII